MRYILEYHKFGSVFDQYQYSRTYEQFEQDLKHRKKYVFRFDDGWAGQLLACEMARSAGVKVVVGITTSFVGRPGYLNWDQVRFIGHDHELANHSVRHEHLETYTFDQLIQELERANDVLTRETGLKPSTYLPTYNLVNDDIRRACDLIGLKLLDQPLTIMYHTTIL